MEILQQPWLWCDKHLGFGRLGNFFLRKEVYRVGIHALAFWLSVPVIQGVDNRTKYFLSRCGYRIPLLHRKNTSFCCDSSEF